MPVQLEVNEEAPVNRLRQQAESATETLSQAAKNWGSLTVGQKDSVLLLVVRTLVHIIPLLVRLAAETRNSRS